MLGLSDKLGSRYIAVRHTGGLEFSQRFLEHEGGWTVQSVTVAVHQARGPDYPSFPGVSSILDGYPAIL